MERIIIQGLELYAYHGVNPGERRDGQIFLLDITLWANLARACESDRLEHTVNYAAVIKEAERAFCREPHSLIERAAEVTAQAILGEFPMVRSLALRVHKPDAPVKRPVTDIIIEIERDRKGKGHE
ncbi:MAG: dihydroneopterin aldolase [Oscillospiraceae bacterium]|nr:dihydroneopterin aldolase [Oscillospiraceae bacterium]